MNLSKNLLPQMENQQVSLKVKQEIFISHEIKISHHPRKVSFA